MLVLLFLFQASLVAEQGIEHFKKLGDKESELHMINGAGFLNESRGRYQLAMNFYDQGISRIHEANKVTATKLLNNSAELYGRCFRPVVKLLGSYQNCSNKMLDQYKRAYKGYGSKLAQDKALGFIQSKIVNLEEELTEIDNADEMPGDFHRESALRERGEVIKKLEFYKSAIKDFE